MKLPRLANAEECTRQQTQRHFFLFFFFDIGMNSGLSSISKYIVKNYLIRLLYLILCVVHARKCVLLLRRRGLLLKAIAYGVRIDKVFHFI